VFGILYGSIYGLLRKRLTRLGSMRNLANSIRFKTLSEVFSGIKDVKLGGYEQVFLKKYDDQAKIFASAQSSAAIAGQLPKYALEAIAFGGVVAVCLFLMRSARGLEEALPMLALYALAGYRMMPALQHTYAQLALLRFSDKALDALCEDLSAVEKTRTTASARGELTLRQSIEFDRVCYRYPGSTRKILDEVSLRIPARSTVGLVGSTGSGKTTTVDILLGLLLPATGKLLVDGVALSPLNLRTWQSMIGYVPQHIYLTDDTVAANIAFGVDSPGEIDSDALIQAAKAARIYEFIVNELPEGFDTMIGERGVRLSGGQKQRLGIARALFRKPQVLILDEATSALDTVTERSVMDEIYALSTELTIVLIAHRLSTVKHCDRIFLLNAGQCVAQGSYDELLQTNPDFQLMVNANESETKPLGTAK
jgi:ATP-binding cassette, subfamily B, bacterial PglK